MRRFGRVLGVRPDSVRRIIKDERVREDPTRSIYAQDFSDRMG